MRKEGIKKKILRAVKAAGVGEAEDHFAREEGRRGTCRLYNSCGRRIDASQSAPFLDSTLFAAVWRTPSSLCYLHGCMYWMLPFAYDRVTSIRAQQSPGYMSSMEYDPLQSSETSIESMNPVSYSYNQL